MLVPKRADTHVISMHAFAGSFKCTTRFRESNMPLHVIFFKINVA